MNTEELEILNALYVNDNNKVLAAKALGINRTRLYRRLDIMKDKGLVNEAYEVKSKEECLKEYRHLADKLASPRRVDEKGFYIIIYNPLGKEKCWGREELRKDRGYYEYDIWANDIDLIIDIGHKLIGQKEFESEISLNEQWYQWKMTGKGKNPYKDM